MFLTGINNKFRIDQEILYYRSTRPIAAYVAHNIYEKVKNYRQEISYSTAT